MTMTHHDGSAEAPRQGRTRWRVTSGCEHPHRKARPLVIAGLLAVAATACSGNDHTGGASHPATSATSPPYAISTSVVADSTTRNIQVWAPTGQGRWPVIYAVPGISGNKSDFDQLGPALARQGVLVFASDYNPTGTAEELARNIECGYRYTRSIAARYGGDLTKPVTAVGYSAGARWVGGLMTPMFGGLMSPMSGPTGSYNGCFTGVPAPNVAIGVNGCYFAYKNLTFPFSTDIGTRDVKLVLITGQADDVCATWQSQKAAKALKAAGLDTTLVSIPGANHYTPMFHNFDHGKWITVLQDPAGQTTLQATLHAIRVAK